MTELMLHTEETAPDGSKAQLKSVKDKYGFAPNLFRVFAQSPAAIKGYAGLAEAFAGSSLDATEQNLVLLAASVENECHYCVAAHSTILSGEGLEDETIQAVRAGNAIPDQKLEALRRFTTRMVRERGRVSEGEIERFFSAGYDRTSLLDVITGLALKTLSNYTNHIAGTPVDEPFSAWKLEGAEAVTA